MRDENWLCTHCGKKLGITRNGRMHVKIARGHEYFAGFPVTGICGRCGTLNELSKPDPPSRTGQR
jgi:DNA-directed RNA polymerase subunit RPC12/RpoP